MEHCSEVVSTACNNRTPTELLAMSEAMVAHINSLNKTFGEKNVSPCASAGINATHPQLGNVSGSVEAVEEKQLQ